VIAVLIVSFGRRAASNDAIREKRRKLAYAQLTEALAWDQVPGSPDDSGHKEDGEDKRPPETKELFDILWCDVEERHIWDVCGFPADDPIYVACVALLKARASPDLAEASRCTRLARLRDSDPGSKPTDEATRVPLFRDGSKLKELVELHTKKIPKAFGPLVTREELREAEATLAATEHDQRLGAMSLLFALFKPELPLYSLALALMAFDSYTGPRTFHAMATSLDGVHDGTLRIEELRASLGETYAKLVLCVFAHLTAWSLTHKVTGRFSSAIRIEVLKGLLRMDTVYFDVHASGVIQERINQDADSLSSKLFHLPLNILSSGLRMVTNSLAIYHMRPELLLYCVAPIPILALLQMKFIKTMHRLHERGRKVSDKVVASTNEMIKELRTVRSFAMEQEEVESYRQNSQYRSSIEEWSSVIHHVCFIAPLVVMFFGVRISALFLGGTYIVSGVLTVGMTVQLGSSADNLQHNMRELMELIPDLIKVTGPIGRICDALNPRPNIEPCPGDAPKRQDPIKGHITFVDVTFAFPSEPQKQVLFGLSFEAAPGEKVAFVGATGCGKSTAIQLIQRFYNQSSGELLLDSIPICEWDVHYLRRQTSVVAQESVLFSTTIRENIVYGLPKVERDAITNDDVERACRQANAWEFVSTFPRKLETFCGERGVKLSGGQKQRLAVARAIIRKPRITLLDEATSALDSKSEEVVQAALDCMIRENAAGCTLVIAHRLSTIKNCDKILCMQKGRVLESGSHDELLQQPIKRSADDKQMVSGLYRDLWATQMGTSEPKVAKASESLVVSRLMGDLADLRAERDQLQSNVAVLKASLGACSPAAHSRARGRLTKVTSLSLAREASTSSSSTSDDSLGDEVDEILELATPPMARRTNSA
jgi:ATP-binding cassette subfamily B protein